MKVVKMGALLLILVSYLGVGVLSAPLDQIPKYINSTRLEFGDQSSLKVTFDGIMHMEPDLFLEPGSILFSWGSGMKTTRGHEVLRVAGSIDVFGNANGKAEDARFGSIPNFLQISKNNVVIVDRYGGCLRLLDRTQQIVSTYAGVCGSRGYSDEDAGKFDHPSDVLLDERDNQSLIVVDAANHALRSVNTGTRKVTTILQTKELMTRPRFATFDLTNKNILYITVKFQIVKLTLDDLKITVLTGMQGRVGSIVDGDPLNARFGYFAAEIVQLDQNHLATADYWNHEIRILDLVTKQISSLCDPLVNGSINTGIGCYLDNPHGLMLHNNTLYIGDHGSIFMIAVSSIPADGQAYRPKCPPNITATLSEGQSLVKVQVEADNELMLSAGEHRYMYTEKGVVCAIFITVQEANTCPGSMSKVASAETQTAWVEFEFRGISQRFELPIGNHQHFLKDGDFSCNFTINVFDPNIQRQVEFQVTYDFECSAMSNDVTKNLISSMVESNFVYIVEMCTGVCNRSQNASPKMACDKKRLVVDYPTNLVYGGDVHDIPQDIHNTLKTRLAQKGTMMSITNIAQVPPVVFPIKTPSGASAATRLATYCLNKTSYDVATDTCN